MNQNINLLGKAAIIEAFGKLDDQEIITRKRSRRALNAFISVGLIWSLVGCGSAPILNHTPGKTYGKIILSSPKVSTRASLVNDRRTEAQWLKKVLEASSTEDFGIQGRSVVKDFRGISANFAAEIGPQVAVQNQTQSNQANFLKGQDAIQQQQQNIAKSQLDLQKQSIANLDEWLQKPENKNFIVDPTTGKLIDLSKGESGAQVLQPGTAQPTPPAPATFPSTTSKIAELERQVALLPGITFPTTPGVQVAPVDRFRDRLAYRQEIRNEILDNHGDDRHDLNGSTLYRFKFEAQIIPEDDSSAWGVIELEPYISYDIEYKELYEHWANYMEENVNERIYSDANRIIKKNDLAHIDPSLKALIQSALWEMETEAGVPPDKIPESVSDVIVWFNKKIEELKQRKPGVVLGSLKAEDIWRELTKTKSALSQSYAANEEKDYREPPEEKLKKEAMENNDSTNRDKVKSVLSQRKEDQEIAALEKAKKAFEKLVNCGGVFTNAETCIAARALQTVFAKKIEDSYGDLACIGMDFPKMSISIIAQNETYFPVDRWKTGFFEPLEKVQSEYCQKDGLAEFRKHLSKQSLPIYIYASTPKDLVERVSEISSARDALDFAVQLKQLSGFTLGNAGLELVKEREGLFESLRRQPIVVGFSSEKNKSVFECEWMEFPCDGRKKESFDPKCKDCEKRFGWVVGPRFKIKNDGRQAHFRHTVVQHGVDAQIALPSWWKSIKFKVRTGWLGENGRLTGLREYVTESIHLPYDVAAFSSVLVKNGSPKARRPEIASTSLYEGADTFDVDGTASIIAWGNNLFRATQVSLGAQLTDDVQILPGMEGIVAKFAPVQDPGDLKIGGKKSVRVRLFSSAGSVDIGAAYIVKRAKDSQKTEVNPDGLAIEFGPQLFAKYDQEYALAVTDGKLPIVFDSVRLKHKTRGWLTLKGVRIHTENEGKKQFIKFTLKLMGYSQADEVAIKDELKDEPLSFSLFVKDTDKDPIVVSQAHPIFVTAVGTDPAPPTCAIKLDDELIGGVKTSGIATLDFTSTLLAKLGEDFPQSPFNLSGVAINAQPCTRSGKLQCTSKVRAKSGALSRFETELRSAADDALGFGKIDCK